MYCLFVVCGLVIHVSSLIKVISEGDLPSVSLLVTIGGSDDEDGLTERLTRFLGIQDDEDNSKDALESGQDGDKTVRVNGGIDDCNDESDINAENKETNVDKKDGKNVANEDRGNVADEINVAVDETNVAVDDKNVRNDNGRTVAKEEVNHVLGNKIAVGYPDLPVDSAQGTQKIGNDTADVEGAVASELVVEPIPGNELSLVSGEWIDVVVTEVKDPERFTVSNVYATICRTGTRWRPKTKWRHFELGLSLMVPVNSLFNN